jgi:hypothetical protein
MSKAKDLGDTNSKDSNNNNSYNNKHSPTNTFNKPSLQSTNNQLA